MSTTVIVNDPVASLFAASVAEQLTSVAPSGKIAPETGWQMTGTAPLTRSEALAEKETPTPPGPAASSVRSAGRTSTGAVVSITITENEADPVRPPESVALQVTFVVPRWKVFPESGAQVGVSDPSWASFALAV